MKILYLAPITDATGYCNQAIDTILALDAAGVDVVVRNVKLATQTVEPPTRIRELEAKDTQGVTHCIQHLLPQYFVHYHGMVNIGYFHVETSHFKPSGWQYYCNLMDALWVSSEQNKEAAEASGVTKPISVVAKGCNAEWFNRSVERLPLPVGNSYVFYHIGDFSERKNTMGLIRAYFEEFSKADNVCLVLKTYVEGVSAQESVRIIQEEINKLKASLRKGVMDVYPPVIIIPQYLDNEGMLRLHKTGDCFVTLEKGAAFNIPAFESIISGNPVIAGGWGGQTAFVNDDNGVLLRYEVESVHGMIRCPYQNLYTCHEEWSVPSISNARIAMRCAYNDRWKLDRKIVEDFQDKYSYVNVGNKLKDTL